MGNLWDEWQIQCLILVSFGLQVFLFLAAGMRRRSQSRILRLLLWLAYLSADSVAIFVLGHLALHANGPRHQLLFFWAPFVLLHLGGQDTLTAFSMQDNDLWMRHLLGLVTQVAAAGYVVSRVSWPDRRLLAAMLLMFLSGCFKYAERTLCLYRASPTRFTEDPWGYLSWSVGLTLEYLTARFREMVKANGRRHSAQTFDTSPSSSGISLVSDFPINDDFTFDSEYPESLLPGLKSNEDRCRVYDYVSIRPIILYERLYTKVPLRLRYIQGPKVNDPLSLLFSSSSQLRCCLGFQAFALLLLFPFLSTSTSLVLFFKVVENGQLYSQADVTVSYVLLVGSIILEVASLVVSILSYAEYRDIFWNRRKQWSKMLGQYNMTTSLIRDDTKCIMSFVPNWIWKHLDDHTSHIPISEDVKMFLLDKLCDYGTTKDWNFASFHGKLALGKWMDTHKDSVSARLESPLISIINDFDLATSVLILHIATDMLYYHDIKSINSNHQTMKKISRELSNYMMYLVFKCGAMLTNKTRLLHDMAQMQMKHDLITPTSLADKEGIMRVYYLEDHLASIEHRSLSEQGHEMLLLKNTSTVVDSSLMSRSYDLAQGLIDIHREADCWDLVAAVWVEMLSIPII